MKIILVYKSRSEENQLEAVEDTSIRCALARSRLRPRCDWHHSNGGVYTILPGVSRVASY